jgi:hypothetical protein
MSALLKLDNFNPTSIQEKTYLASDYASGTTLAVKSSQNITLNLYALVGAIGQEQTELRLIDAVSSNNLTLHTALSNTHNSYTDVRVLKANKIQVYRAANVDGSVPADSAFSVLGSPVDIDTDELTTTYADPIGSSSYWYKYTYFNEATSVESSLADSEAIRGGNVHYVSLDEVRHEAGFDNNTYLSDVVVGESRTTAEGEVNDTLFGTYTVPFEDPVPPQITYITKMLAAGYLLSTDYGAFASGTNKDGKAKLDEARALLAKLKSQQKELIDSTGNTLVTASRVSGWPDDTTKDAEPEDNGGAQIFKITDRF